MFHISAVSYLVLEVEESDLCWGNGCGLRGLGES